MALPDIDAELAAEAKALLGEADVEEAERALLARFLFAPPARQLVAGERNGLPLDRVLRQLQALLRMLSGRNLKLAYSDPPATDNINIYLPRALPAPEESADLLVYRAMGLIQIGFSMHQLLDDRPLLAEIHKDWVLRSAWHLLAARYVLRRWSESFPGLAEDFKRIPFHEKAGIMRVNVTVVPREGMPGAFLPLYDDLVHCMAWKRPGPEGNIAREAIQRIDRHQGPGIKALLLGQAQRLREHFRQLRLGPPPLPFYLGIIRPEWILADLSRDIAYEQEWKKGNKPLRQLMEAIARKGGQPTPPPPGPIPVQKPSLTQRLLSRFSGPDLSQAPAYGRLRDAYQEQRQGPSESAPMLESVARPEEEGSRYEEWDDGLGIYKLAATRVFDVEAPIGGLEAYQRIVTANQRAIKEIRCRFEALKVEERWLHGQREGAELDMGRLITAMADIRAGQQPEERFYKRFVRQRQQVAILTMVDVSGSTQGRVLPAEQEAVVLFSEGLRTLGMPHAFHAFSNDGPEDCRFQRIKGFDEAYSDTVYKRLGNLRASGATRMGAFVRHATRILAARPQGRRILLLLSDGRPEDRGEYRGNYGIRDTTLAVQEARRAGVHVFCISVDMAEDAERYLETIFGKPGYLRLPDVDLLPKRLPEVFRRMIR